MVRRLRRKVVLGSLILFGVWELVKHLWLMRLPMTWYHLSSLVVEVLFAAGIGLFVYTVLVRYQRRLEALNADLTQINAQCAAANEELRRLTRLKDDLTAMIVHDLRNPLTAVHGSLALLAEKDQQLPEDQYRALLDMARGNAQRMNEMITALLDVTRLESGTLPVTPSRIHLHHLMTDLRVEFLLRSEQAGVKLNWIESPGDDVVWADYDLTRRILGNLIGNALEFTPRGGMIDIGWERNEGKGVMTLHVTDTGPGIPEKYRERIFDKFGTAEARKQGEKASIGLGLAFCKLAVEAQGGRIWVESEPGEGSTFRFTLPLSRHEA